MKQRNKLPYCQWYPGDWIRDTRTLTLEERGAWKDLLAWIWIRGETGRIQMSFDELAGLWGVSTEHATEIVLSLDRKKIGVIERDLSGQITFVSRRIERDQLALESNRSRQHRYYEKWGPRPEGWTVVRAQVLEMDEHKCAYCGRRATEVDHVVPKSKGGPTILSNLVAICKKCNWHKNSMTLDEANMTFYQAFKGTKRLINVIQTDKKSETRSQKSEKTPPISPKGGGVDLVVIPEDPKPTHVDFMERFRAAYEDKTGQPFKWDRKDFVVADKLIRAHGIDAVVTKAKTLYVLCRDRAAWFTKDGFASLTIGKLSSQWNSILPSAHLTEEQEFKIEMEKQEAIRERINSVIARGRKSAHQ